jgi:predicted Zn-dependent protease with MMP-like domain
MPTPSRIAVASVVALAAGISSSVLLGGFSINPTFHLIQVIALGVLGVAVIFGGAILIAFRLSDYTAPESEAEFEALVVESERLARQGLAVEPDEEEFLDLDPFNDEDFEELVRDALDDLPDLLREALQRNVAVVISNGGRRQRAYGLYQGDGATRDNYPDRIIIFRDTLRRDFGHDAELLREQVVVTVRHELAHHIGFDELGVQGLGL